MNVQPFPCAALTLPISVTTTASTSTALANKGSVLRLVNEGANMAFVAITAAGTSAVATLPNATETATSTPVLPGSDIVLSIPSDTVQNISAITRTGGTTLHAIVGEGL